MKSTMQRQITDYMDKNKIHVLAIQETSIPSTTQYMTSNYTFFLFGNEQKREYAGSGFVIHNRIKHTIVSAASRGDRLAC
eukprot:1760209-Alexandrium_andersonii.AAC.1